MVATIKIINTPSPCMVTCVGGGGEDLNIDSLSKSQVYKFVKCHHLYLRSSELNSSYN